MATVTFPCPRPPPPRFCIGSHPMQTVALPGTAASCTKIFTAPWLRRRTPPPKNSSHMTPRLCPRPIHVVRHSSTYDLNLGDKLFESGSKDGGVDGFHGGEKGTVKPCDGGAGAIGPGVGGRRSVRPGRPPSVRSHRKFPDLNPPS
jgi:hypothetical protein